MPVRIYHVHGHCTWYAGIARGTTSTPLQNNVSQHCTPTQYSCTQLLSCCCTAVHVHVHVHVVLSTAASPQLSSTHMPTQRALSRAGRGVVLPPSILLLLSTSPWTVVRHASLHIPTQLAGLRHFRSSTHHLRARVERILPFSLLGRSIFTSTHRPLKLLLSPLLGVKR